MTNPPSLTRRLIMGLGGATLLVWVFAPTIAALKLYEVVNVLSDNLLELHAKSLEPTLIDVLNGEPNSDYIAGVPGHAPSFENNWTMWYQVRNRDGKVLIYSPENPPFPSAPLPEGFSYTATDRWYTLKMDDGNTLHMAQPLSIRHKAIMDAAVSLFLPILVFLPFSVTLSWIVFRRSLAPIEVLRREIGLRDGGNLSLMGSSGLPAELAPIAASVDRLLERLRTTLEAEREFATNSAHELRTPIAGAFAQMQRLVAELPQGSAKMRARGVERSLLSLSCFVEKLLQLARAESGIGIADQAIDLVRTVQLEIEDFRKKPHYAGRLILDVDGCPALMRKVDVDAFAFPLRNLIENALTHGLPDAPITISVRSDGTIAIANAGPAVPPSDLENLTKRFWRGATPAAGSGLGLHIANMFIERMGARLEFASPARGREDGFEAIIRFPE
ncbi:HAMP domain-containing sensor histidine kinase [Mesorhizobium sp. WSM2239]|uniref:histidine kinase n=2 Tax=unclassified Mesorhizobium TaxID=325217 RepID=A0AAU8D5Z9_9HYPH